MFRTLSTVILGRAESASPDSKTFAAEYGFRIRRHAAPRNDIRLPLAKILAAVAVLFALPASGQPGPPTDQQIDDGRMVYDDLCAMCHGRDMVNPGIASFDLRKFPKDDFARFQNSVLNGKGTSMPSWRSQISDDDLTVLWAYVRGGP